ncbi:MAG: lysophospholipid acyltransferase family protein [Prevotellaceae bacterium]|nr:lysophospholipid acyltransferase family protein [Prevotellaceae bacterium]
MQAQLNRRWKGDTYGSRWMHKSLTSMLRVVDVRLVYAFAALFVVPFTLKRPGAFIVYRYFRKRIGYGKLHSLWATYENHCMFAQVVIDRFAMYAGKHFTLHIQDYEHFARLVEKPECFLQLSAHVGNYELSGYSLNSEAKPISALVFAGEKSTVMSSRRRMFGPNKVTMIPIMPDMSHLYAVNNALSAGEIVSFPADRVFGSEKTVDVNFLGGLVSLPAGPFRMAVMRGCEVLAINAMKTGLRKYDIYVSSLNWDRGAKRNSQVKELASAYASQLEEIVRLYPTQWYNYFEFWEQ